VSCCKPLVTLWEWKTVDCDDDWLCTACQVARMVTKHFQELQQRELRAEREDVQKMKRIAVSLAKMVREFWSNIEKVCHALKVLHDNDVYYQGVCFRMFVNYMYAASSMCIPTTALSNQQYVQISLQTLLVWRQEGHPGCKKLGVGLLVVMI